jgi:hypothetical protein
MLAKLSTSPECYAGQNHGGNHAQFRAITSAGDDRADARRTRSGQSRDQSFWENGRAAPSNAAATDLQSLQDAMLFLEQFQGFALCLNPSLPSPALPR